VVHALIVRLKMKSLLMLFLSIGLMSLRAEEDRTVQAISEALRSSKIAKLELTKATFEDALALIRAEWERQHPALDFPVALAQYERDQGYPPLVTMSVHEVPFIKALQYVGESSRRRLVKRSDLLTFEDFGLIIEDWITKSHPASEDLLTKLGIGKHPTAEELASAYAHYGVQLDDWMKLGYHDGFIIVFALDEQQEQIAGINHLLSHGFKITKGEQDGTGQPATRPESKSEGSDKPQPEAEGRSR
jgi:hypothetical protein